MTEAEKKAWATAKLCHCADVLGRIPQKGDFDEVTRSRIKAFLGPWPRALEAAGLKEAKPKPPKSRKRTKKATERKNT